MKNKKNIPLKITIGLIIIFWLYSLKNSFWGDHSLPSDVNEIFKKIIFAKILMFAIIFILMRYGEVGFSDLGVSGQNFRKRILSGAGFGALAFIIVNIGLSPILQNIDWGTDSTEGINMAIYFKERRHLIIWILLAIFGGGFIEEFQRIFILTRFEEWLGKNGLYLALIIDIIIFGLAHNYQGFDGAISAGISGLIFALVYLRKRSGIETISCHAVYDIIGIMMGHLMMK